MRLRIFNRSSAPDSRIHALIQFASEFFVSVTGRVRVTFTESRKLGKNYSPAPGKTRENYQRLFGGHCAWNRHDPTISVRSTLNDNHPCLPFRREVLGYFPGCKIPIQPYEHRSVDEIIIHVAAHEFAHLLPRGHKFRKSRIEVFCENRATEVLEAFRSPAGQSRYAALKAELELPAPAKPEIAPDEAVRQEIEKLEARLKRWESKRKRAETAIRKLNQAIKYRHKKLKL